MHNVKKVKRKEADLYSAFIEVPYTQGAGIRRTVHYYRVLQDFLQVLTGPLHVLMQDF